MYTHSATFPKPDYNHQFSVKIAHCFNFRRHQIGVYFVTNAICLPHASLQWTIMAETQEEMTSIEMKVARQVEVISYDLNFTSVADTSLNWAKKMSLYYCPVLLWGSQSPKRQVSQGAGPSWWWLGDVGDHASIQQVCIFLLH